MGKLNNWTPKRIKWIKKRILIGAIVGKESENRK